MLVAILHDHVPPGAREDEKDVLVQASFVRSCLERLGHQTRTLEVGTDLGPVADLVAGRGGARPDAVFNLVEAMMGSGRLIAVVPALLDALGVAYTGCPADAVYLTSGKLLTKRWLRATGLPTPDWLETRDLAREGGADPARRPDDAADADPPRPVPAGAWIVKSVWEHASVGLDEDSVVEASDTAALGAALQRLSPRIGGEGFVERYVEGREFNLGLLEWASPDRPPAEPEALPPAEIAFVDYPPDRRRVVGFSAKWVEDSFAYRHTARLYEFPPADAVLLDRLRALALRCWHVFGLRGYARVDFRVDARGEPWILEINSNPCISPDAGFMAAAERAGLRGEDVVGRILRAAVARRG